MSIATVTRVEDERPPRLLLKFAEAADALGVSVRHVRNLVTDGSLPSVRIGTRIHRIALVDLEGYIAQLERGR